MSFSNSGPDFWHGQKPSTEQWNGAFLLKIDASDGYAVNLTSFDGEFTRPTIYDALLTLARNPVSPNEGATKAYVDALVAGDVEEAPSDGTTYGRINAAWARVLPLAGGQLTGPLLLVGAPVVPDHAATKAYVDAAFTDAPSDGVAYGRLNGAWTATLPLAGGSLTGALLLASDPTQPLQAASKAYVDANAGGGPGGGIAEAPNDGNAYARQNQTWTRIDDLPIDGGSYP